VTTLLASKLSYGALIFLLSGSGIVSPVPEELTLVTAGYFVAGGFMDPYYVIAIGIFSILLGDSILFFLAKAGSRYAHNVHAKLIRYGLENTWIFAPNHPLRAVFILRFFTGLRMISPVFAGFNEATWAGFLVTDLAALLIYVPLLVYLGAFFHDSFLKFIATFELLRHVIFWSMIAFVGGEVAFMHPAVRRAIAKYFARKPEEHE
jgi:membrane protein DedA with SNARE-associated domain